MVVVVVALCAALIAGSVAWRLGLRRSRRIEGRMAGERAPFGALANEDLLTGLPNKRAFDDRLETELRRAAREYYPVALVVLDLDRFKQINDTWGHPVGDEALVKLAQHVEAELRAGDICGRVGGDEFVLALVRADAHSAERVLGRLRRALEGVTIGPAGERLAFSAGIAEFPRHATEREQLVRCADSALYRGKAYGRGRAAIYTPGVGTDGTHGQDTEEAARLRSLLATLQALAKAVDAKHRFTAGHSERVATYAVALARSLGFGEGRLARGGHGGAPRRGAARRGTSGGAAARRREDRHPRDDPDEGGPAQPRGARGAATALGARPRDALGRGHARARALGEPPARALRRRGLSLRPRGPRDPRREPHPARGGRARPDDAPERPAPRAAPTRGAGGAVLLRGQPGGPGDSRARDRAGAERRAEDREPRRAAGPAARLGGRALPPGLLRRFSPLPGPVRRCRAGRGCGRVQRAG